MFINSIAIQILGRHESLNVVDGIESSYSQSNDLVTNLRVQVVTDSDHVPAHSNAAMLNVVRNSKPPQLRLHGGDILVCLQVCAVLCRHVGATVFPTKEAAAMASDCKRPACQ